MSLRFREYNDTISLKGRDIPDITRKAKYSNCEYFMQLNLQGSHVWMGFKEPFESTIDMLHAVYYKARTEKGYAYICLGLWKKHPKPHELYNTIMSANQSVDAVIDDQEVSVFMNRGETEHLVLRHPEYQGSFDSDLPSFVNY